MKRITMVMVLAMLLAACGGGDEQEDVQVCLDPTTLQPESVCMSAGCCAFTAAG